MNESVHPRPELSVVIPAYNERGNLCPLHEELTASLDDFVPSYELIFVDDGSRDGSYEILQALHEQDDRVTVVRFRRNFGQTAAFTAGFDYARADLVVTMDADGQNDPADIPKLVAKLRGGDYDIVVGWRVERRENWVRRLLSGVANAIISRVSDISLHDRGCSLKVFRADLVRHIRLYGELHRFMPELASTVGARVAEVPVNDRSRRQGTSKYGAISRTPRVILDLITVSFLMGFFSSPMRFFGTVAIVTGILGVGIDGALVLTKLIRGLIDGAEAFRAYTIANRPLFFLGILLILLSVQFLMMGILGEMIMRTYYETQDKPTYFVRNVLR